MARFIQKVDILANCILFMHLLKKFDKDNQVWMKRRRTKDYTVNKMCKKNL